MLLCPNIFQSDYLRNKTLKLMHKTMFFLLHAWRNVVSWPLQTIFIHYSGIRNTQCLTNLCFITNCTVYFTQTLLNINTCTLFACIIRLGVRYNRCREVSSVNTIWVFDLKQTLSLKHKWFLIKAIDCWTWVDDPSWNNRWVSVHKIQFNYIWNSTQTLAFHFSELIKPMEIVLNPCITHFIFQCLYF